MSKEKQVEPELSKEQLAERRVEITTFYKENIKHLKVQKEYEELLRDVEKARVERLQAQMYLAQAYAAQDEESKSDAGKEFEKEVNTVRPLKRS